MSRSYRKTNIGGIAGSSEKQDKKIWHSRMRSHEKQRIIKGLKKEEGFDNFVTTHFREVSNPWSMSKDGKVYWGDWKEHLVWFNLDDKEDMSFLEKSYFNKSFIFKKYRSK